MNRVKLTLPDHFPFSTRIKIRITDLNYGGHVGNDTFLSLVHDARQQFLKHHGYGELEFEGIGLIMADAVIEFKAEINFGDEVEIFVAAADFTRLGFDLYYKMEIVRTDENILAGKVKTGMLCYDYAAKKVVSVPDSAKQKLSASH
jgi:YbgC/YbaW family acyl-CoA thioester hydrolase